MNGTLDRIAACDQGSKDPSLSGGTTRPDGLIAFQFQFSDRHWDGFPDSRFTSDSPSRVNLELLEEQLPSGDAEARAALRQVP